MEKKVPRGIRNNNPLNIEYNAATQWQGLDNPPSDGRFCRFVSSAYGYRAAIKILRAYQKKHGLCTLRAMITRWAPPVENDTSAYVQRVAHLAKLRADGEVDMYSDKVVERLLSAMCVVECGRYGNHYDIRAGYELAGR